MLENPLTNITILDLYHSWSCSSVTVRFGMPVDRFLRIVFSGLFTAHVGHSSPLGSTLSLIARRKAFSSSTPPLSSSITRMASMSALIEF